MARLNIFLRQSKGVWIGLVLIALLLLRSRRWLLEMTGSAELDFEIKTTWDGRTIDHPSVRLNLYNTDHGLGVDIDAPFFKDLPKPSGNAGLPFQALWEYEVVEAFFLNEKNHYLEAEFSPHGQHLVLLLSDRRKMFKDMLNITYGAVINGSSWKGKAIIPWEYFPQNIIKFNAYAIHGSGKERVYESLFPVPHGKFTEPDFHRLDYFQKVDFGNIIPKTVKHEDALGLWKHLST